MGNRPLVEVVDDLCGLAAGRDPRLQSWANAPSLAVVACFPRAVRWLFHAAGVSLPQGKVRVLNMRTQPPEEIRQQLMKDDGLSMLEEESASCASANHQSSIINHPSGWVPWFPVIDYDRCKNCKQCLNFCLFGVYQLSAEGQVQVRNPSGCKTNCPACARMCPQEAIIFPKYADAPINGDERGTGVPPMSSGHGQDTRATGDILDQIRRHGAGRKRFSTEPREASSTRSCPTLEGLRRELGIPDDVLASLSPAEVQRIMSEKGPKPPSDSHPQAGEKDQKRHE
ncbi:MAG: ferredoxin family protein [Planctomycetes bacterium]|nr:ferredoxin family protein [Planctomycetota bacterium]